MLTPEESYRQRGDLRGVYMCVRNEYEYYLYDRIWNKLVKKGKIYPITRNLVENLLLDKPASPAQTSDFGIAEPSHYSALQEAVFGTHDPEWEDIKFGSVDHFEGLNMLMQSFERRLIELNQCIRCDSKLNAFVHKYVPDLADHVQFVTGYDEGFQDHLE